MDIAPITLRDAAELHAKDLKGLQDLKTGTIKNYLTTYSRLAWWIENKDASRPALTTDLTADLIEEWFRDYVSVHCAASYAQKRSAASAIVKWLMRKHYLTPGINPVDDLPKRRQTRSARRARWLTDAEVLRLLEIARRSGHLRNYYLILFVRLTGRRIGEVVGDADDQTPLVWGDVRWDADEIEWDNNKGRKLDKVMPLTPRIAAVLKAWADVYAREMGVEQPHANWLLFPAVTAVGPVRKGRTRRCILAPNHRMTNPDKVLRPLLQQAGLYQKAGDSWHMLRKSFGNQRKQIATEQGRGDAWELAQQSLDHESVTTTRIYVDDREDYDRYAAWANATPELGDDAMQAIPELAGLAQEAEEAPAAADARVSGEVYTSSPENLASVVDLTSRRRLRAVT